jgi:ATP-binding cassette subfamily B protein
MILIAIVLLVVQAYANLSVPNYLGDIVNIGINQGGIQNACPTAVNSTEMNRFFLFMTPANQSYVRGNYTLIAANSSDYLTKYPADVNTSIYVLNDVNSSVSDQLSNIMGPAILIVYTLEQLIVNASYRNSFNANLSSTFGTINTSAQLFAILQLPKYTPLLVNITNTINQKFSLLDSTSITIGATKAIQSYYTDLGMDMSKIQLDYMIGVGTTMILLTLMAMVCSFVVGFLAAKVGTNMAADIRRDVFKKIQSFSNTEFDKFSTASLITRSTNDVTQFQSMMIMIIRVIFYAPIVGIGGIILAIDQAPSMWWIIALTVATVITLVMTIFFLALPKFKYFQKYVDRLNLVARESLTGMMVVRAFNQQDFEQKRFEKANNDVTTVSLFVNRLMTMLFPLMMLVMYLVIISITWVGSNQVGNGVLQVGGMIVFMQYTILIVIAFVMLSVMFITIPRAAVSADRIAEVLKKELEIQDPKDSKHFSEPFHGSIEFRNVSFHYPGTEENILKDISFIAQSGETTAFIGPTGSGKSTIVNLIPRLYDVSEGAILVDGLDIREVFQHELRDKIGFVPQKSILFSGTINTNLLYADEEATADMLQSAIQISQAAEFVVTKPDGMATEIAQGGMNVSGGQKQRLSIARAIVKKPPIYILDDSFSALDFKTDAALRRAFRSYAAGSTLLIVSQRISTIKNAEQIVVLEEGKIVGKGTHAELMENCEFYKEIALSQLSMEELS